MTLAHVGGIHAVLYFAPVAFVAFGLWYAGHQLPDEDELEPYDDLFDDPDR
ncbi:MAG: hypothetical protein M0P31_15920 [Solirubrobacteraceae bacterium]|nr:hypothetical protein [Solirubrobacteraceae bacterium]